MQTNIPSNAIESITPGFTLGACDVPTSFAEQMQAAEVLAKAGVMVPRALRNQTGAVFAMMTYARALDLPIGVAMQHLHPFEDKDGNTHLEMSARLMGALVRRCGHRIVPVSENASKVVLQLKRCDDPVTPYFAEYTRADVEKAGLLSHFGHIKYPKDMLFARCLSRLTRRWCSEATMGAYLIGEVSTGGPEVEDTSAVEAAELYAQAEQATTVREIQALGDRARYQGLLPVYLDGETLERRLWQLLRAQMTEEGVTIIGGEIVPQEAASAAPAGPIADSAPADPAPVADCGCSIAQAAAHGPGTCPFRFADEPVEL